MPLQNRNSPFQYCIYIILNVTHTIPNLIASPTLWRYWRLIMSIMLQVVFSHPLHNTSHFQPLSVTGLARPGMFGNRRGTVPPVLRRFQAQDQRPIVVQLRLRPVATNNMGAAWRCHAGRRHGGFRWWRPCPPTLTLDILGQTTFRASQSQGDMRQSHEFHSEHTCNGFPRRDRIQNKHRSRKRQVE